MSAEHSVLIPRKFLIFINPKAGPQRGESEFKQYVQPMLDVAEINYVVVVTSEFVCEHVSLCAKALICS